MKLKQLERHARMTARALAVAEVATLTPEGFAKARRAAAAEVGSTYTQIAAFLERRREWLTNEADMKWFTAPRNRRDGESREHAARRHATAKERRAAAAEVGHILARLYPENVGRWS